MSRAPRRPDGWGGPDDGSHRALRLVEPPDVQPAGPRLFPFRAALGIAALIVGFAWWTGAWMLPLPGSLLASESRPVMILHYEERAEGDPDPVGRYTAALPPRPAARLPVHLAAERPSFPRGPEVVINAAPFALAEDWNGAERGGWQERPGNN